MSKYHFKPGFIFENDFINEGQSITDPFSVPQRSKTVEHESRFTAGEKTQKLLKNQEIES